MTLAVKKLIPPGPRFRRMAGLLLVTAFMGGNAAFAHAQANPATPKQEGAQKREGGRAPQLRSETFRLMDAYVISNLQESLGLTDEQFAKVLPIVKKLQTDRRRCAMRRINSLRTLRRSLQSGTATESGVGEMLKEVRGAVADEHETTMSNLEALDAVLTPLQQAKYRVFEAEVDARLRHLLARNQDRER